MTLSYDDLTDLAGHRTITDVPCPLCGPGRRSPANRKRKVLRIWRTEHGFASYCCARCGASGYALANGVKIEPRRCSVAAEARVAGVILPAQDDADQQARIEIALKLWDAAVPLRSCPGNRGEPIVTTGWLYLIECRGLHVGLLDNDLAHALRWHEGVGAVIALMTDPLTGEPCGIHRTFINPDGTKRDRKMLGKAGVIRVSPDKNWNSSASPRASRMLLPCCCPASLRCGRRHQPAPSSASLSFLGSSTCSSSATTMRSVGEPHTTPLTDTSSRARVSLCTFQPAPKTGARL